MTTHGPLPLPILRYSAAGNEYWVSRSRLISLFGRAASGCRLEHGATRSVVGLAVAVFMQPVHTTATQGTCVHVHHNPDRSQLATSGAYYALQNMENKGSECPQQRKAS